MVEAFLVSTGVVAVGEMGDKTQWLAMMLAARYRRPAPILLGILVATLANHALAGALGGWLADAFTPGLLRWVVGLSFLGVAAWMLVPDRPDPQARVEASRLGVFGTTTLAFFIAEMGDKTQIATAVLAARYPDLLAVIGGTTFGIVLASAPAVWLGGALASSLSMKWVHRLAAALFALLGVSALLSDGSFV